MLHIKEEHKQTMDVSLDWRDRQQSSERQRLEYGEQSTWEGEKKKSKRKFQKSAQILLNLWLITKLHRSWEWNIWGEVKNDYHGGEKNTLELTQDWQVSKFYSAKGRNLIEHLKHARGPLEMLYLRSKANLAPNVKIILDAF